MFSSFEGDFRTRPTVSIRGSNKIQTKEELLNKTREERKKREELRLQNRSAVKVQSCFRSFSTRKRTKDDWRQHFDAQQSTAKKGSSVEQLKSLTAHLISFFHPSKDPDRMSWLCQMFVTEKVKVVEATSASDLFDWPFRIARLLICSMQCIATAPSSQKISSILRFVEIYSSPETYGNNPSDGQISSGLIVTTIYSQLAGRDYFGYARAFCEARVPPLLEETMKAPTPHAQAALDMLSRPLAVLYSNQTISSEIQSKGMASLIDKIFSQPYTEQIELFVIPALAAHPSMPFEHFCHAISRLCDESEDARTSPWLLHSFLKVSVKHLASLDTQQMSIFLHVLNQLTGQLVDIKGLVPTVNAQDQEDDDSDDEEDGQDQAMEVQDCADDVRRVAEASLELLNDESMVFRIVSEGVKSVESLKDMSRVCHHLLVLHPLALHKFRLLYTLAFRPVFLHNLWKLIRETKRDTVKVGGSGGVPLITVICRGSRPTHVERDEIVPLMAVFASLFGYLLVTIHDTEFYGDQQRRSDLDDAGISLKRKNSTNNSGGGSCSHWMPFTLSELVPMSLALRDVTIGLVELAFPETRPTVREDYQNAVGGGASAASSTSAAVSSDVRIWSHLFKTTVVLVRQLYTRDTRRQFCPADHWINDRITLPPLDHRGGAGNDLSLRRSRLRQYRPFQGLRGLTREELMEEGAPLSAKEVRLATVLRELPYAIAFQQRVLVFHSLVAKDRDEYQGDIVHFPGQGKQIHIHVRRNFIYEDAFEKLSEENEPNLKLKLRVQLVNTAGLDEAGIDGGGLFREFMSQLLKTAFDPNRGFFKLTTDQYLYPNPNVEQIEPNYIPHYYFIGRILGKALYENMLVELPLTSFFLSKLLGQKSVNVSIDHLSSLDPELYKNLLYLKTYEGDVRDMELDFTVVSEELGKTQVEELKPDGSSIAVNNENRIEYIHLVADYKLNRQIRSQTNAFRQGLADVVNLDWLRMFSHRELQVLISGADHEIDVAQLRRFTSYGSGYDNDHPTVVAFWEVVEEMTETQKRRLLKFVTSCSRPPLLGFKELDPPFAIQNVGPEQRLPTASTCMNLLKLPNFPDKATLKTKLLYAIESDAGFELS